MEFQDFLLVKVLEIFINLFKSLIPINNKIIKNMNLN